jgi:pimeloyl-ACP methyl ester carboxylesterase
MQDARDKAQVLADAAREAGLLVEEAALPTDAWFKSGGLRLHYLDWGNAHLPAMVLLHGGAQTAHSWDFFALTMRPRWHVIALDLRGHGDSDWAKDGDYSRDSQLKDIEALLEVTRVRNPVFVGMGGGGAQSAAYEATHKGTARAVVSIDIAPEPDRDGVREISTFVNGPEELDSIEAFVERAAAYNPRRRPDQLRNSLVNNLRQLPNGKWTWKYDPIVRSGYARAAEAPDGARSGQPWPTADVVCPVLIVRGEQSKVVTDAAARQLAASFPNGHLAVVPDAGHTVPGDNPKGFQDAIDVFLTQHVSAIDRPSTTARP